MLLLKTASIRVPCVTSQPYRKQSCATQFFSFILRFGTITNDQHTNPSKYLQMFPPFLKATAAPQFRIRARAAVAARPPAQALPAIAVDAFSGVA